MTSGLIHRAKTGFAGGKILCLASATALLAAISPVQAAGTIAGTDIVNVAQASYDDGGGGTITVDSNPVTITVDELLDVTVVSSDTGDVPVSPGATSQVLTYQVTNTGNGTEAFTLSADTARTGDDFDTVFEQIVLDTNDNGVYDPGVDTIYTPGTNDPSLAADESVTVFVLSEIPAAANDAERAEVELSAVALTGSGTPGTTFTGQGDGGGDAVVGSTGADAGDSGFFVVQVADVALVKSATIVDPFGGTEAVPGATITYQLVATTSGTGTLNNLTIADDIPNDTTYVTESITLEGGALTDSDADADEGSFDGSQIAVALGNIAGGQTRTITFQVTID
ncbi:conserved repeat domain-containing protein [Parasphingorhabdus marina DSM 22363]|uniref:Conserved repeat domain-containing protein n=1 Tax=Parasphingorhabdus marina DSM 22363 TaxID=1123272 RepID=A0A1N6G335_9SPHN|nr:hypothetical protein [Parasphingorhabdus marina]SIO01949.1 conserved repeat domain-containing protein [Parasphingorhabdus marina DSM 22363]